MQGSQSTEGRLYRDKDWIAKTPAVANGGIALAVVEPEMLGWPKIATLLEDYGFIAFASAEKKTVFDQIRKWLGGEDDLPYWESFTSDASAVMPICDGIVGRSDRGLTLASQRAPDAALIDEVVRLNRAVGVSPLPVWYMRGEGPPSLTSWIRSSDGSMVACANGSMRYHAESRMAGTYYVGSVSVAPSERGKGFGALVLALLIRDGLTGFGAHTVTGIAQPSNIPSRRMLARCGLLHDPSRATVICNRSGAFHTR